MRYLVLLTGTNPDTPPPGELMDGIMKLGEEATKAGTLLDTAGLLPSAMGARVGLAGGKLSVTDGPFAESKEMISYAIYDVRTKEEVVEWASRFLRLHRDHWAGWEGEAEIRQLFSPEDFGPPPA
ncbi:MAG: YciI family protein [Actinopolymorphaceae bacterium]